MEEEHKIEEARHAEESAMVMVEKERAKCRAVMENAEAQKRLAELEVKKRVHAEMQAFKEAEQRKRASESVGHDGSYRRYTIEEIEEATNFFAEHRKIGEGGYGPVYKCYLDHTPVAIKILRPDAAQGRAQFQQEVTEIIPINFKHNMKSSCIDSRKKVTCPAEILNPSYYSERRDGVKD